MRGRDSGAAWMRGALGSRLGIVRRDSLLGDPLKEGRGVDKALEPSRCE